MSPTTLLFKILPSGTPIPSHGIRGSHGVAILTRELTMESFSPTSVERSPCGVIGFSSILRLIIGLVLAAGIVSADAQVPQIPSVSQEELASHLMTYVPPIYPATAQSAQVQGHVVINVEISPDGFVRSTKVLSGPPMLSRAGVSAVKQWRYSPFHS